jgi:hippurate hydrolase
MSAHLEDLYRDLHRHPELSFAERRTARIVSARLTGLGLRVIEGIGGTGVVGVLENGEGPVVLLRADMDGLPVTEETGLDYASRERSTDDHGVDVGVMHACGHDMHVVCLIGAVERLADRQDEWRGTVLALFQPGEEHGGGAEVMIGDGLYDRIPRPDVVLGQHVFPLPAGRVGVHPGAAMAAVDTLEVTMFGRGGHGSQPETTIDPVVMAASAVLRLQTIVSREVSPKDPAVVTVGTLHAGTKNNIIPSIATLGISVRSFDETVRARLLGAVERIIAAEATASGAPQAPRMEFVERYPVTVNDPEATGRVVDAFHSEFGDDYVVDPGALTGSEDVGNLATAASAPLVYWLLGGVEPEKYFAAVSSGTLDADIPTNHSAHFAPVIQPTLDVGVRALEVAALTWLDARARDQRAK